MSTLLPAPAGPAEPATLTSMEPELEVSDEHMELVSSSVGISPLRTVMKGMGGIVLRVTSQISVPQTIILVQQL